MIAAVIIYCVLLWFSVVAVLAFSESRAMHRTVLTILDNYILAWVWPLMTGATDPWYWFIGLEVISAAIVLRQPAGRPQALIGASYLVQTAIHASYGAMGWASVAADPVLYWWMITSVGFVQLIMLGGWFIRELARDRDLFRSREMAWSTPDKGVEE